MNFSKLPHLYEPWEHHHRSLLSSFMAIAASLTSCDLASILIGRLSSSHRDTEYIHDNKGIPMIYYWSWPQSKFPLLKLFLRDVSLLWSECATRAPPSLSPPPLVCLSVFCLNDKATLTSSTEKISQPNKKSVSKILVWIWQGTQQYKNFIFRFNRNINLPQIHNNWIKFIKMSLNWCTFFHS